MKKKANIIISVIGAIIILIVIIWGLNSDSATYQNVNAPRPFQGNSDANIILAEFSDFQCPACQNAKLLVDELLEKYRDQIKFEYKHFPLIALHPNAYNAALAAECANDQGKFWEMYDLLFDHQNNLAKDDLKLYASQIDGIKTDSFNICLDTKAKKKIVDADLNEAEAKGISGTPTFFLNGREVEDYGELDNLIQNLL
ncbi:MAG: disulfide bond formation protein DsbA [Candidatus Kerfeldbacteria bacterium CG_4_10_14_0_8_um_filter_42_10]|uniref:Disulfide bond formation protein DsbA n=1 Tax=Candidatus Kerfeldbacteria bacterium CG_4_10_14_0_8_um_filter_42_10 TaxID=2014248 RepID=A0A2M7RHS6_9BACT|nr:MAG: disulfide bond formation protein DsbA [Candidatus Kerfeldbacteria bacterium CG_4_10_14_0_8_um_filter_42_10]